jgi:hypothetical protein
LFTAHFNAKIEIVFQSSPKGIRMGIFDDTLHLKYKISFLLVLSTKISTFELPASRIPNNQFNPKRFFILLNIQLMAVGIQ